MNTSLNNNVPAAGLSVSWEGLRRTPRGHAAADLIISKNDDVKYSVYLRGEVVLHFTSADRARARHAARLLRLAGVGAEARRADGGGVWYVAEGRGSYTGMYQGQSGVTPPKGLKGEC